MSSSGLSHQVRDSAVRGGPSVDDRVICLIENWDARFSVLGLGMWSVYLGLLYPSVCLSLSMTLHPCTFLILLPNPSPSPPLPISVLLTPDLFSHTHPRTPHPSQSNSATPAQTSTATSTSTTASASKTPNSSNATSTSYPCFDRSLRLLRNGRVCMG